MSQPTISLDPRFRAGRTMVQTGRAGDGAIEIFGTLLEESRNEYGHASVEAAACYYEYGNALFRAMPDLGLDQANDLGTNGGATGSLKEQEEEKEGKKEKEREEGEKKTEKGNDTVNDADDKDDFNLALELMETAWSILDKYVQEGSQLPATLMSLREWAVDQLPRVLLGIGDVLTALNRQADAADAYSRAIPYREKAMEDIKADKNKGLDLGHLKKIRQLVEANVLVSEAILACPADEDVVTTETKDLLVKASERIDYARGYYDKARDDLQETVFLMGKIAGAGKDLGSEKTDVCFLATLLMGVGTTLATLDEEDAARGTESTPPTKKQKQK